MINAKQRSLYLDAHLYTLYIFFRQKLFVLHMPLKLEPINIVCGNIFVEFKNALWVYSVVQLLLHMKIFVNFGLKSK